MELQSDNVESAQSKFSAIKAEALHRILVAPYHVGTTRSRQIPEVKQRRARLVLGRVTTWEHRVCYTTFFSCFWSSFFCG